MATKKPQLPTVVSPKGIAAYCYLGKPDTEGKFADGKYKTNLRLKKGVGENEEFFKMICKAHDEAGGPDNLCPVKDGDTENAKRVKKKKDERPEWAGHYIAKFKSKYPPQLLQGKEELPAEKAPFSGDIIRVGFAILPYESGDNQGVALQLRAVKLLERRARQDYSGAFGDEDDDEGDDTQDQESSERKAPAGNSKGKGDGDF